MHCSIPFLVVRYKLPLANYSYLCTIVANIAVMFEPLKDYCLRILPFTDEELRAVDEYFVEKTFKRRELLLEAPCPCRHLFFIVKGSIRYFRIKEDDGSETTCDISLDNQWATEFVSFTSGTPARLSLQTLEETTVYCIDKARLYALYKAFPRYETFGRLITERILQQSIDTSVSLASQKPEERFKHLMQTRAELFQRVPRKFIANLLGISPESLSRLQKRIYSKNKNS